MERKDDLSGPPAERRRPLHFVSSKGRESYVDRTGKVDEGRADMPATISLYANAGLGKKGAPLSDGQFFLITWVGPNVFKMTEVVTPVQPPPGGFGPLSNIYTVNFETPQANIRVFSPSRNNSTTLNGVSHNQSREVVL
jgi:hypothetical protein